MHTHIHIFVSIIIGMFLCVFEDISFSSFTSFSKLTPVMPNFIPLTVVFIILFEPLIDRDENTQVSSHWVAVMRPTPHKSHAHTQTHKYMRTHTYTPTHNRMHTHSQAHVHISSPLVCVNSEQLRQGFRCAMRVLSWVIRFHSRYCIMSCKI